MLPNQRVVPEHLLPAVRAAVEKVNQRADRIGAPRMALSVSEVTLRKIPQTDAPGILADRFEPVVTITIEGSAIKVAGWLLQGRVDFEDGHILVSSRPGAELPPKYRSIGPTCDHCHVNRARNSVFVFQHEDDSASYTQVGRSCLADFLGHSPEHVLWAAREFACIMDEIDDELRDRGVRNHTRVDLVEVMVAAAHAIRLHGFTSKARAEELEICSTSSDVMALLFDRKARAEYRPTDEDAAKAEATIAWVKSEFGAREEKSDYEYNALELVSMHAVRINRIGLLTSLIAAYERAMGLIVERAKLVNAHVGTIGQRTEFLATYVGENWFESSYGRMVVARFATPAGLLVYKGSSPFWPDTVGAGDELKFTATIKDHADYKGMAQTLVQRCKLAKA